MSDNPAEMEIPKIRIRESATLNQKITVKITAKTSTERGREYRARKMALKNATDEGSISSMSILVQAEVDQANSPSHLPKKTKTPAQCSRDYRARKKALKNATAEVHQENSPSFLPKTPAQRSREYRARKMALKYASDQGSISPMSILVQAEVDQANSPSHLPKTPAQRSREYRARKMARKMALKNATDQGSISSKSILVQLLLDQTNSPSHLPKKPKTPAQCSRDYRARKKALKTATAEVHQEISPSFLPKTPAQCSHDYRARKKALKIATDHNSLDSTSIVVQAEVHQENSPSFLPKTPAQRSRDCRARKGALKNATDQDSMGSTSIIVQAEVVEVDIDESPAHMMEPQVELDEEIDHNTLEPSVELDENVEPHVQIDEGTDHHEGNVYPFDTLAVEFYEGTEDATRTNYAEAGAADFQNDGAQDSENAHDDSQCSNVDTTVDSVDNSNSEVEAMDSSYKEEEDNTNYNEMQRAYLEDFFSSSASPSVDESSNPSFERIPLSRFPSIVKVVERAEYETIQILYQLLYQRSAWDTQEMLSKSILDFSGFNFNKSSEEYYNREMMLQTLPNSVLVKIGAILCLDQVKNVLSNVGLGRHDLINAIMEFLALPKKKTRGPRINNSNARKSASEAVEPCGCRNSCLSKFNKAERELVATYHTTLKGKKNSDAYFLNLIQVNKANKKTDDDSKKHRDYKYTYKIKFGRKEVGVCKGGFMMLHNVKMSKLNQLQSRLKKGNIPKSLLAAVVYPLPEGQVEEEEEETSKDTAKKENESSENSISNSLTNSVEDLTESPPLKPINVSDSKDEVRKLEDEMKKSMSKKVPAVVVEKIDPKKIKPQKPDKNSINDKVKEDSEGSVKKKGEVVKKKLKEFPLVVKALDEASEELLIDLHFLLFLTSADSNKLKDNILEFDGFSFGSDCEEYDERNESLQRMSGKLITDVARSFSLGVMSKREETIQNILSFLMKPDESYLRTSASVPVILSDVELDDIEGFSDSDESITCEVVEKKVECIDLLSSGEDSDKEGCKTLPVVKKEKKDVSSKVTPKPPVAAPPITTPSVAAPTPKPQVVQPTPSTGGSSKSGGIRRLRDFETIQKIVNTHPPEYLVDIYELLFLKKHDTTTLRNEILDFTGFTFEKGSQDYVKRKQVLDRMLYNNVRRVYNTLIHNSTEVKVFSKPTMINEIFQFLFKLPDHDTSVRPLPPGAKTLMPKQPSSVPVTKALKPTPVVNAPPATSPASILPSQTGKLSDLKRVFQRVACFPCEYLVDVHKLLFMSDCDSKVIRQNIFGFKGFTFSVDSSEFQQRKMYLEYLTFHSLRKISSVLTTRSVDLRNSTKHELASHLTDVLAEYCNTVVDPDAVPVTKGNKANLTPKVATSNVEKIVVTPVIEGIQSVAPSNSSSTNKSPKSGKASSGSLKISIVDTRSISSPAVTTSSPSPRGRKRKSQTVRQVVSDKRAAPPTQPADASQFADIHLPEVEQYRQIYGANLSVYPNVPTITGIASFGSPVTQTFPQIVPQAMTFPLVSPYIQQSPQVIGLQSAALTMTTPIITQVSTKPPELIVPADIEHISPEPQNKSQGGNADDKINISKESPEKDDEEDGDQPLSSLIGHPTDEVLKKLIADIVEKTDLQDITMNKVIKKVYDEYSKFDLSYRKEFIKSTLRTILYKLGEKSEKKEGNRDSSSPDCSVTTTDINDSFSPGSPVDD